MRSVAVLLLTMVALFRPSEARCPPYFDIFNQACYYVGTHDVRSYGQAKERCRDLGGYLLNINAQLEYDHVIEIIREKNFDGYWMGGVYNNHKWNWEKTDTFGNTEIYPMNPEDSYYQNWATGEENDASSGLETNSAIMVRHDVEPYKWFSLNKWFPFGISTLQMSYVCEADWIDI